MLIMPDPSYLDPNRVEADVKRRQEMISKGKGSDPLIALLTLAWLLLVMVPFRLLRALVRLLAKAFSRRATSSKAPKERQRRA